MTPEKLAALVDNSTEHGRRRGPGRRLRRMVLRIDSGLIEKVDAFRAKLPGDAGQASRAAVYRALIVLALGVAERDMAEEKRRREAEGGIL